MRFVHFAALFFAVACKDGPPEDSTPPLPDDDGDGYDTSEDCNDDDPTIHPGADEHCDGIDWNCDGVADLGAVDAFTYYLDSDNDGYGDPDSPQRACTQPQHFVAVSSDCDDHNNLVYPGAQEVCDDEDTDEDCDGVADDADPSVDTTTYTAFYPDADSDGYGSGAAVMACDGGANTAEVLGDCDEGNAAVNPGETEVCGNHLDDDCDGTTNGCNPGGELSLANYGRVTGSAGDLLGISLAGGHDLNNDGVDDWAVGATQTSASGAGYVRVYGSNTGTALATLTGAARGSETGAALSMNSSSTTGYLAIGAPGLSNDNGAMYLLSSPVSTSTLSGPLRSGSGSEEMGAAVVVGWTNNGVASCGFSSVSQVIDCGDSTFDAGSSQVVMATLDIDGDGFSEVIFGIPSTDSGSAQMLGDGVDVLFVGGDTGDEFGGALSQGGDFDGDGYDDVLVGAPSRSSNAGTAYLYAGLPSNGYVYARNADLTLSGGESGDRVGRSVAMLDIDGDGQLDFAVGAPGADGAESDQGAVYVFYGPASGALNIADADAVLWGESTFAAAGSTMARAGDVNSDGYDDLAVGAPGESAGGSLAGAAYLVLGGSL